MELIDVVDKFGTPTGEVLDKDEVHKKNLLHNEVATFLVNEKNEILLERRSKNKKYSPNKWGLCAGHVDTGETLKSAAIREIKEEVGIDVHENDLIPFGEVEHFIDETNSHLTHFYYLLCNKKESEFTIQEEELSEVKWFSYAEIIKKINNQDNDTVFDKERIYLFETLKKSVFK